MLLPLSLFGYGEWYYFEPTPHRQTAKTAMIATESTYFHPYRRIYALFYDELRNVNRFYYWNCEVKSGQPIPAWVQLCSLPGTPIDIGVSLAFHSIPASWENLIFVIKGQNNREFWVYNLETKKWRRLEDLPITPSSFTSLEAGGYTFWNDYPCVSLYLRDNPSDRFWRYHYPYTPLVQAPITWWEKLKPVYILSNTPSQMAYNPRRKSMYAIIQASGDETDLKEYLIGENGWEDREWLRYRSGLGLQLASLGVVGAENFRPYNAEDTLYFFRGDNTNEFDDYRCRRNWWYTTPGNPCLKVKEGSGLAYGSLNLDSCLLEGMWAFFGNNTDTFGFFYPYGNEEGGGQSFTGGLRNQPLKVLNNQREKYLKFSCPNSRLEIYNSLGKLLYQTLIKEEIKWGYRNFSSGVYFYRLTSSAFSWTGKITISK